MQEVIQTPPKTILEVYQMLPEGTRSGFQLNKAEFTALKKEKGKLSSLLLKHTFKF